MDKTLLARCEYDFLREDARLGKNIAYLTIAGSHAYGTNNENSDVDIRGFAVEAVDTLLTGKAFEQVENKNTDTVIFGLRKFFHLCAGCNPNIIEMLGTKPEHVLHMNDIGKKVRDNAEIFLSKRAFKTFAGYATAQLRRLQNALAHDSYSEREKNQHILKSIEHMMISTLNDIGKKVRDNAEIFLPKRAFKTFAGYATAQLRRLQNALAHDSYSEREKNQHILKSIEHMMISTRVAYALNDAVINFKMRNDDIVVTVNARDLPLRKFLAVNSDLENMLNNYDKVNHRNRKKDDAHLNKHAMHLIRLYLTGIDILAGRGVITYRENDLPLLRNIRAGEIPFADIFEMADEYEAQLTSAYRNSKLPDNPDVAKIDKLLLEIYHEY